MSIVQQNPTTNDIAKLITNVNKTYIGQNKITITNYDADTAPQVTAGSTFDNNGTQWVNDALATPTGYAGMNNSATFYLTYDESAGIFVYLQAAPAWSDAKQGWYTGNDRYLFSMYKDSGGTLYQRKRILEKQFLKPINLSIKIIDIGDWNMDTGTSVDVTHGLSDYKKVRRISVIIRDDNDANYFDLNRGTTGGTMSAGVNLIDTTKITLVRETGGLFDGVDYNATSFNRGWITIEYLE